MTSFRAILFVGLTILSFSVRAQGGDETKSAPAAAACETNLIASPDSLLGISTQTDFFRVIYGETATATEHNIQRVVVAVDHFIRIGDTNQAKNVMIEFWPRRGEPWTLTLRTLWYQVEYAQLRMATAEQRIHHLDYLIKAYPEHAEALEGLKTDEQNTIDSQMQIYGKYIKTYIRVRRHLISFVRNQGTPDALDDEARMSSTGAPAVKAEAPAKDGGSEMSLRTARWLLEDIGSRDAIVLSSAPRIDAEFNDALKSIGIPHKDASPYFFSQFLKDANSVEPWAFNSGDDDLTDASKIPGWNPQTGWNREAGALDKNILAFKEMLLRSLNTQILEIKLDSERQAQVRAVFEGFLTKPPVARAIMTVLGRGLPGPLASWVTNNGVMDKLFGTLRDMELNDKYAYDLARLDRNTQLSPKDKVMELRQLMSKGTMDEQKDLDVLEMLARRSDMVDFWVMTVKTVEDPTNLDYFGDLRKKVEDLEASRQEGNLKPMSPIYTVSPMDNLVRTAAYIYLAMRSPQMMAWVSAHAHLAAGFLHH